MDASFRCWIILSGTLLISYVAWRLARPSATRASARLGAHFVDPVTVVFRDEPSGVTIVLSGRLSFNLPNEGRISFEDRVNGETLEIGPPFEERGAGELRFRDVYQRPADYPLTFSRTAFTHIDGRLVCVSRFGLTVEGPGTVTARATTAYPAMRTIHLPETGEVCEARPGAP